MNGGVSIDVPAMMKQKEDAVEGLTKGIEMLFKKNKVMLPTTNSCAESKGGTLR